MTKLKDRVDQRAKELFSFLQPEEAVSPINTPQYPAYEEDFDIVKLMEESRDPDTGLLRDLKINDKDLPQASSLYDFCFNVIGKEMHPPWFIQMWTGLLLFAEVCPVCSNKKWFDLDYIANHVDKAKPSAEIKEGFKILKHGVCPKCKRTKYDLAKNHGLNIYTELVNVLGQRSGKSSSAATLAAYQLHRFLKFPRLSDHTNAMQRSTELTGTFVSLTFRKAFALIWTPFVNVINESQWFQDYHSLLDDNQTRYGIELYRQKDEYLKYHHKGLKLYPTGPMANTLRGDTRFLAIIDELGLFPLPSGDDDEDEKTKRANADEAHKSLTNSLVTVQTIQQELLRRGLNCPPAMMIGVSSPISERDKVMRRLAESRTEEGQKNILGINLPTWKVNPFIQRDTPIIKQAYASNPEKAERDFGARPPRVHNVFIKHTQIPHTLFTNKNTHVLSYTYDKPGLLYGRVQRNGNMPKFPSVVTLDAGYSNNSFTLTAGHFDFDKQKTVVSTVVEVMTHDKRKVDFNGIYTDIILPIMKDVNCCALLADQWQSLDLLSRAQNDMGLLPNGKPRCVAKQHSPRRADFDFIVSMMESGNISFPELSKELYDKTISEVLEFRTLLNSPVQHLLLQMTTVRDEGPGRNPTKGEGFTDDIFRAMVLLSKIHNDKIMERLKTHQQYMVTAGNTVSGHVKPVFIPRGMF